MSEVTTTAPVSEAAPAEGDKSQTPPPSNLPPPAAAKNPQEEQARARFAALTQKQRQLRAEQARAQALRKDLEAREARLLESEQLWKSDPWKALEARGLSYDDLTKLKLNGGKVTPEMEVKAIRDKLAQLERLDQERQQQAEIRAKEAAQQQFQETVQAYQQNIQEFIKSQAEQFDLCAQENPEEISEQIYELIREHYDRTREETGTPVLLSMKEACEVVENYLETLYDERHSKSKKLQRKYQRIQQEQKERQAAQEGERGIPQDIPDGVPKNITNDTGPRVPGLLDERTEQERWAAAMRALG